jgi:Na+/H+ antiporter NhaD/arsenite permease-like protein
MQAMLGMLSASQIDHLQFLQASHLKPLTMQSWKYIQAISAGAVMFGAMTYIGNGPNFMVKSIAEHQKVKTPHFMEYIIFFSIPVLVPLFLVIWFIFFR